MRAVRPRRHPRIDLRLLPPRPRVVRPRAVRGRQGELPEFRHGDVQPEHGESAEREEAGLAALRPRPSQPTTVVVVAQPVRAAELERCTGGRIAFAEADNVWEDPLADLGRGAVKGLELYDGYFMSYSHFPEASAQGLAETLNGRIREANDRLAWEDVLPKVRSMGEYRKDGSTNIDFLMYDGDFFVPVVRLDLLEKYGKPLPNTWEEVAELAVFFNGKDLNDDGIDGDYGFWCVRRRCRMECRYDGGLPAH